MSSNKLEISLTTKFGISKKKKKRKIENQKLNQVINKAITNYSKNL